MRKRFVLPPFKYEAYLLCLSCSISLCRLVVYKLRYFTDPDLILLPGLHPPGTPGISVRLSYPYIRFIRLVNQLFPLRIMTKT